MQVMHDLWGGVSYFRKCPGFRATSGMFGTWVEKLRSRVWEIETVLVKAIRLRFWEAFVLTAQSWD